MKKILAYSAGFLALVALVVAVVGLVQYYWPHPSRVVTVTIPKRATADDVADILAREDIIQSVLAFKAAVRLEGVAAKLQPGRYAFKQGAQYSDIIAKLIKGLVKHTYRIPIPEGFTIDDISRRLSSSTPIDGTEFRSLAVQSAPEMGTQFAFLKGDPSPSLQGYLFPKTYLVSDKTTPRQLIVLMLRQFEREAAPLDWKRARARRLNLHQILVIASMVEKEARVPRERALVSAVIYNRLAKGMRLQNDATVQYALPQRRSRLTAEDLRVPSPYNTYLNAGLPPGPICNPGVPSIKAALRPAKVGHIFYVLKNRRGEHFFTASYSEFLVAKARYKRGLTQ